MAESKSSRFARMFIELILEAVGRDLFMPAPQWPKLLSYEILSVTGPIPKDVHVVGTCTYREGKTARFSVDFQMDLLPSVDETWELRTGQADLLLQSGEKVDTFKVSFSHGKVATADLLKETPVTP